MQAVQEQVAGLMDEKSGRKKLQERKATLSRHLYQSDLPPEEKQLHVSLEKQSWL